MAAVAVIALVIEAIHTTVSRPIGALVPISRVPNAPSYTVPLSVAATATTPGIFFDSTAWLNIVSMGLRLGMAHLLVGDDLATRNPRRCGAASLAQRGGHLNRAHTTRARRRPYDVGR